MQEVPAAAKKPRKKVLATSGGGKKAAARPKAQQSAGAPQAGSDLGGSGAPSAPAARGARTALLKVFAAAQAASAPAEYARKLRQLFAKSLKTLADERAFAADFALCLDYIIASRAGIEKLTHERLFRCLERFWAVSQKEDERAAGGAREDESSPTDRLLLELIRHLLKGVEAKEKQVRERVMRTLQGCVNSLAYIDDDALYRDIKLRLFGRILDKEPVVRALAIAALANFQDGDDDDDDDSPDVVSCFNDLLKTDSNP